jgi:tetratricopeptide (TPR) repeat protein
VGPDPVLAVELEVRLAALARVRDRFDEAGKHAQAAVAMAEKLGPDGALRLSETLTELGKFYNERARPNDARAAFERAQELARARLGPDHPRIATLDDAIGNVLYDLSQYRESLPYYLHGLAVNEAALGPEHAEVARLYYDLGFAEDSLGQTADALAHLKRSVAIYEKALGPESQPLAAALGGLAKIDFGRGEVEQSYPLYVRALAIDLKLLGPDHTRTANAHNDVARALADLGRYAEAEAHYRTALDVFERTLGHAHWKVAMTLRNLAYLDVDQRRWDRALDEFQRSLEVAQKVLPPTSLHVLFALAGVGQAQLHLGRTAQARATLEEALQRLEAAHALDRDLGLTRFALAQALWTQRTDRPRALQLAHLARKSLAEEGKRGTADVAEVDAWLARR